MLNSRGMTVWFVAKSLFFVAAFDSINAVALAAPEIDVEACQGEPLGIGRMTTYLSKDEPPGMLDVWKVWVADPERRALHPAILVEAVPGEKGVAGDRRHRVTVWFLFRGAAPFDFALMSRSGYALDPIPIREARVTPVENAAVRRRMLNEWWQSYRTRLREIEQDPAWPGQLEGYMASMLARRLDLLPPFAPRALQEDRMPLIAERMAASNSLLEAGMVRRELERDALRAPSPSDLRAGQMLPDAATFPALDIPNVPPETAVEPLARHVPAECHYIRCRNMAGFEWLWTKAYSRATSLLHLMTLRGSHDGARVRLARQLGFRTERDYENPLPNLPVVDLAVIGMDSLLDEGAAIGLLLQARDSAALQGAVNGHRLATRGTNAPVTERTIQIEGRPVSFVSSPDNSVRSFYAIDGDFHLLTNSRMLARRFLQASAGMDRLADLHEFHYARHVMPLSRNDDLFAYVSGPFLRNLASPQYRIEMLRRLQADTEIEIAQCARLAALVEKQPAESIEQLKAGGFLPEQFGARPDGSHARLAEGAAFDSLRGARRTFLPVPDVEISNVTADEARGYAEFVRRQTELRALVPIVAAARRKPTIHGRGERQSQTDHVILDVVLLGGGIRGDLPRALHEAARRPPLASDTPAAEPQKEIRWGRFREEFNPADFPATFVIRDGWGLPGMIFDRNEDLVLRPIVPGTLRDLFSGTPLGTDSQRVGRIRQALEWCRDSKAVDAPQPLRQLLAALAPDLKLSDQGENPGLILGGARAVMPMVRSHASAGSRRIRNGNVRFAAQIIYQLQMPIQEAKEWGVRILGRSMPGVGGHDTAVLKGGQKIDLPPDLGLDYQRDQDPLSRASVPDHLMAFIDWFYYVNNWKLAISADREQRTFSVHAEIDFLDWEH